VTGTVVAVVGGGERGAAVAVDTVPRLVDDSGAMVADVDVDVVVGADGVVGEADADISVDASVEVAVVAGDGSELAAA
jgi:hypothetical protein